MNPEDVPEAWRKRMPDQTKPALRTVSVLRPGIHTDISADDYHNDVCDAPSLSASIASILVNQSPAHAHAAHPRLGGYRRKPTKEMDAGTLLHCLLLGEEHRLEIVEERDWKKKVAKEARDAAVKAGKVAVLRHQFERATDLSDKLRGKFLQLGFDIRDGDREVTLVWTERADDGTEVLCRGRCDHLLNNVITDLKSTESAHPEACGKSMVNFGADIQHAAYTSALEQLDPRWLGRTDFTFMFFEKVPPFAITPAGPDGKMIALGRYNWRLAVNAWAACTKSGKWPEYTTGKVLVSPPPWAVRKMLEEEDAA